MLFQHHGKYWFLLGGMTIGLGLYIGVCLIILDVLITPQMIHTYRLPIELGFVDAKTLNFESALDGITLCGWIVPANEKNK